MHFLDLRTILFADTINFIACTLFVTALWHQNRCRFSGLGYLVATFVAQTLSLLLITLRGVIPDLASIALANSLACAASLLALMGFERFLGKTRSQTANFFLLAAYSSLFVFFVLRDVSLAIRSFAVAIGLLAIWTQIVWLLLVRGDRATRRVTFGVGLVYVGFCLVNVVRIARYLVAPFPDGDYLRSGMFEVLVLQCYGILTISVTIALFLMVDRRLEMELSSREETFAAAFRMAPYGLLLTRFADGTVFEVNNGFLDMTGFTREEVVDRSTLDLRIWPDAEDRESVARELQANGRVRDREQRFRKKTDELFTTIFSAEIITIGSQPCILAGFSDISQRKRMEDEIRELSLRDSLTGLLNRRGFFVMTGQKIRESNRTGMKLQVVFIDADGLKKINDGLGHEEGDRALQDVASVLLATFRQSDIVARVGGDEFTVCFHESVDVQSEEALVRLQNNLNAINEQHSRPYVLAISFGVATYDPEAPHSIDELLSEADRLMYSHKQQKAGW